MTAPIRILNPPPEPKPLLTRREIEVLHLTCDGKTHEEIAMILGITRHTAGSYRDRLYMKTGCHNAVGLLRWAIRQGMVKA